MPRHSGESRSLRRELFILNANAAVSYLGVTRPLVTRAAEAIAETGLHDFAERGLVFAMDGVLYNGTFALIDRFTHTGRRTAQRTLSGMVIGGLSLVAPVIDHQLQKYGLDPATSYNLAYGGMFLTTRSLHTWYCWRRGWLNQESES